MSLTWIPPEEVTIDQLEIEIRRVAKVGLPLDRKTAGDLLPELKSIWLRALAPTERDSRIATLNQTFREWLADLSGSQPKHCGTRYPNSIDVLFDTFSNSPASSHIRTIGPRAGLVPGRSSRDLKARWERIGHIEHYSISHVRNNVVPTMCSELAVYIYNDLLPFRSSAEATTVFNALPPLAGPPLPEPEPHRDDTEEVLAYNRREEEKWFPVYVDKYAIWASYFTARTHLFEFKDARRTNLRSKAASEAKRKFNAERQRLGKLLEEWSRRYPALSAGPLFEEVPGRPGKNYSIPGFLLELDVEAGVSKS